MNEIKSMRADEVQVGDIIWDAQRNVVTKVTHLSVSTAIDTALVGKPGTFVQWLLGNEWPVPVSRPAPDADRYIEAILGGRLMFNFPLGSVKTDAQAKRVDRITARWMRLKGRDPVAELNFPAA